MWLTLPEERCFAKRVGPSFNFEFCKSTKVSQVHWTKASSFSIHSVKGSPLQCAIKKQIFIAGWQAPILKEATLWTIYWEPLQRSSPLVWMSPATHAQSVLAHEEV